MLFPRGIEQAEKIEQDGYNAAKNNLGPLLNGMPAQTIRQAARQAALSFQNSGQPLRVKIWGMGVVRYYHEMASSQTCLKEKMLLNANIAGDQCGQVTSTK